MNSDPTAVQFHSLSGIHLAAIWFCLSENIIDNVASIRESVFTFPSFIFQFQCNYLVGSCLKRSSVAWCWPVGKDKEWFCVCGVVLLFSFGICW